MRKKKRVIDQNNSGIRRGGSLGRYSRNAGILFIGTDTDADDILFGQADAIIDRNHARAYCSGSGQSFDAEPRSHNRVQYVSVGKVGLIFPIRQGEEFIGVLQKTVDRRVCLSASSCPGCDLGARDLGGMRAIADPVSATSAPKFMVFSESVRHPNFVNSALFP